MKKLTLLIALLTMSFQVALSPESPLLHSIYTISSFLGDPVLGTHRCATKLALIDKMYDEESGFTRIGKKGQCLIGTLICGCTSIGTLLPSISMRYLAICMAKEPYCYRKGVAKEKVVVGDEVSILSWNVCGTLGGYVYIYGGVEPWWKRIDPICNEILECNADVVCLCEVFDNQMAEEIMRRLERDYTHFYFNMGTQTIGLNSGLFVASRIKLEDPQFSPFTCEELGDKFCKIARGFFSCEIENVGHLVTTHLQHSITPSAPHVSEIEARRVELQRILEEVDGKTKVVLTGDLNACEKELGMLDLQETFIEDFPKDDSSWGGSCLCAKGSCKPMNLDHTLVKGAHRITTTFVETSFEKERYKFSALSDHKGLFSKIKLKN